MSCFDQSSDSKAELEEDAAKLLQLTSSCSSPQEVLDKMGIMVQLEDELLGIKHLLFFIVL